MNRHHRRLMLTASGQPLTVVRDSPCEPAATPAVVAGRSDEVARNAEESRPQADATELGRLHAAIAHATPENHPRTAKLLGAGRRKSAQKVIEESGEVALEAVKHNRDGIIRESADLLYHLVVLWRRADVDPADVWGEMRRRGDALGIAEKLPKSRALPAPGCEH
jgi:phosphoribosyl-ATP pyrophosphohydrolase